MGLFYIFILRVSSLSEFNNRHSFTTRLLFTVVPSELYVGDETLDALHTAMVADMKELCENGFSVLELHRIGELIGFSYFTMHRIKID